VFEITKTIGKLFDNNLKKKMGCEERNTDFYLELSRKNITFSWY